MKKLQKLRRSEDEPTSEAVMTRKKMEQKVKTDSSAAPWVKAKTSETQGNLLKLQDINRKTKHNKEIRNQTEGCVNTDDVEWYQESANNVF